MNNHLSIFHKNQSGNAKIGKHGGHPGPRPAKRKAWVLAAALFLGVVLATTTVFAAVNQPISSVAPQAAADFIVDDPADPGAPTCTPGSCSLRAAITAANAGSVTSTQTIDFDLAYPLTITLSSPLPVITGSVVISGPGAANLVVSGDDLYWVFTVGDGAYFTLNGSQSGGGMYSTAAPGSSTTTGP